MKGLAYAALISSTLAACANPYGLKLNSINLEAEQTSGVIQFTDPKLYKREALINERKGERAYLNKLLGKAEADTFTIQPEIVRELETIRAFSASLGLKVDPAAGANFQRDTEIADLKHQYELTRLDMQLSQLKRDAELLKDQLDKQQAPSQPAGTPDSSSAVNSNVTAPDLATLITQIETLRGKLEARLGADVPPPKKTTGVAGPIDTFNDISAYRDVLKSAINAASLDELHDKDGNSLFRVQLKATVLPGTKDYLDTLGVLRMEVGPPTLSNEDKRQLYLKWLLHVNRNLNLVPDPRTPPEEQRIRTSPGLVTLGQIGDLYEITFLELPKLGLKAAEQAKADTQCKGVQQAQLRPDLCWYVRIATPPMSPNGVTPAQLLDVSVQFPDSATGTLLGARKSLITGKDYQGAGIPVDTFKLDDKCEGFKSPASSTAVLLGADEKEKGTTPEEALAKAQSVRTWWPYVSAVIGFLTEIDVSNSAVAQSIPSQLSQTLDKIRSVHEAAGAFLVAVAAKNPPCGAQILTPANTVTPPLFNTIIDKIQTETRTTVYDVAPIERVQRVSTAARAADAIALAAAAAGQLPSYGIGASGNFAYSRTATGKADALERVPLVVGFAEPGTNTNEKKTMPSFGWLLGPQVSVDPEKQALVLSQRVKPYDLYADLSLPGWWPYFELKTYTAWAPNWRSASNGHTILTDNALERVVRVPMAQNSADLDGLTTLLIEKSTGERVAYPSILSIEPQVVSACAGSIKFQVRGENIWRASLVHVGGLAIRDADIEVLPDMRGVLVSVPTKDIPKINDGPNVVTVWTKDGPASFPITFENKRKPDGTCEERRAQAPKPKGPVITAVAPATISVCDTDAVFTVLGKNLAGANSAVFGTMAATRVKQLKPDDGTVVQIQVNGIDGKKKMVRLDKVTLAVRTPKGVATSDIGVVQSPTECK